MDKDAALGEDEESLKEKVLFLSRIMKAHPDRFILFDSDGRYLEISTSDERFLNDKPERYLGRTIYESFPSQMAEPLASFILRATRGQMSGLIEYQLPVEGALRWFEGRAAPAGLLNGKHIAVFVSRDITDRKSTEEALRKALDEKTVLIRELQHRVKNNLSMVSSLVSIEAGHLASDEDAKSFEHVQDRIRAMALMYEMLYSSSESVLDVNLAAYLRTLVESLRESYLGGKYGKIELAVDLADMRLDLKRAVPLGIAVNELVTNAMKYAFPGDREGIIAVALRQDEGNAYLTIEDNGVGLEGVTGPSFGKPTFAEGSGTGLNLVQLLVDQIGGSITRGSGPGGVGLRYDIRLKNV